VKKDNQELVNRITTIMHGQGRVDHINKLYVVKEINNSSSRVQSRVQSRVNSSQRSPARNKTDSTSSRGREYQCNHQLTSESTGAAGPEINITEGGRNE